jgi:hypothetical protein
MATKKSLSADIRQKLEEALLEALKRHTARASGTRKKKKAPARKKKAGKKKAAKKKLAKKRPARRRRA